MLLHTALQQHSIAELPIDQQVQGTPVERGKMEDNIILLFQWQDQLAVNCKQKKSWSLYQSSALQVGRWNSVSINWPFLPYTLIKKNTHTQIPRDVLPYISCASNIHLLFTAWSMQKKDRMPLAKCLIINAMGNTTFRKLNMSIMNFSTQGWRRTE